jgi:hypothetical protein
VLTPGTEVGFFPFNNLTGPVADQIRVELGRMGSFFTGATVEVRWVSEMVPLTERRAGWVLKPLHDP